MTTFPGVARFRGARLQNELPGPLSLRAAAGLAQKHLIKNPKAHNLTKKKPCILNPPNPNPNS